MKKGRAIIVSERTEFNPDTDILYKMYYTFFQRNLRLYPASKNNRYFGLLPWIQMTACFAPLWVMLVVLFEKLVIKDQFLPDGKLAGIVLVVPLWAATYYLLFLLYRTDITTGVSPSSDYHKFAGNGKLYYLLAAVLVTAPILIMVVLRYIGFIV
ncbi:MAG TPA: hypothetical protein VGN64_21645 [Dyadobacter sp.]|nr:hypothetical protein [Dyadobacter sp.]